MNIFKAGAGKIFQRKSDRYTADTIYVPDHITLEDLMEEYTVVDNSYCEYLENINIDENETD